MKLIVVFCSGLLLFANSPAMAQTPPREISVTADSWAWLPPDHLRLTIQISESGKNAAEAAAKVETSRDAIIKALGKVAAGAVIRNRGENFSGAQSASVTASSIVNVVQYIGVETSELKLASSIIDAALQAGAKSVDEVTYSVRKREAEKQQAIAAATKLAQEKAAAIASSLGVTLGAPQGASIVEEQPAKTRRLQAQLGEDAFNYSDEDYHVFVIMQYAL